MVIIGAGFTGILTALHLVRQQTTTKFDVIVIEKSATFGRGLAYGVEGDAFRLNVPARNMGAWHDKPGDFSQWLTANGYGVDESDYVPRDWYGKYLQSLLAEYSDARLSLRSGEVLDVSQLNEHSFETMLSDGSVVKSSHVVVAIGNIERSRFQGFSVSDTFLAPYKPESYRGISSAHEILIIGTGLSAVDCVLECERHGFRGKYRMISRHGRLPLAHEINAASGRSYARDFFRGTLREIVHRFAIEARAAGSSSDLIAAMRPFNQELWKGFSAADKRRFLRHVRPLWEPHRHRIPVRAAATLNQLLDNGRLVVEAGRLVSITNHGESGTAAVKLRSKTEVTHKYTRVFLCTGSEGKLTDSEMPLIKNLLKRNLISPGPLGLGVASHSQSRTSASPNFLVVGPMLREELWEITAVAELRRAAADAAGQIARFAHRF